MNKPCSSRWSGFTLVEIMVTVGLLSSLFLITGIVLVRTAKAWRAQEAYVGVSAGLRDATLAITQELEAAALEDDSTVSPPVQGLKIAADAESLTYQTPSGFEGGQWHPLSTLRLRSEDRNRNLKLDGKEDADGNGFLDRVLEKLVDLNGDGKFEGAGETRILARNIDDLEFSREEKSSLITVTVTSSHEDSASRRVVRDANTFTVVVRN